LQPGGSGNISSAGYLGLPKRSNGVILIFSISSRTWHFQVKICPVSIAHIHNIPLVTHCSIIYATRGKYFCFFYIWLYISHSLSVPQKASQLCLDSDEHRHILVIDTSASRKSWEAFFFKAGGSSIYFFPEWNKKISH
jgi:hypothetical protein